MLSENSTKEQINQAINHNKSGFFLQLGKTKQGEWMDNNQIAYAKSGIPHIGFNGVFHCNFTTEELPKKINEMKEFFKKNNTGFMWWVTSSSKPDNLSDELKNQGFKIFTQPPCMAIQLSQLSESFNSNPDLFIKQVKTETELQEWIDSALECFDFPQPLKNQSFEYFNHALKNNIYQFYMGIQNCKVVSTSLLYCDSHIAGIYWVGTLKNFRKKGFGKDLTYQCLLEAKKSGYTYAALQASAMGQPVYTNLGFNITDQMTFFYFI